MHYSELGLSNTSEMFADALRNRYAVPAYNFNNLEQLQAIIMACAETDSPVILQISKGVRQYVGVTMLAHMARGATELARELGLSKPIALHLDHGTDFQICKDCIDMGFSSVMIDASDKSFDENVELSRKVAEYAHKYDVSVEAELGSLYGIEEDAPSAGAIAPRRRGGCHREAVTGGDSVSDSKASPPSSASPTLPPKRGENYSHYTNPDDVVRFVELTGVDSLAVSIGTSHGAYKMNCHPGASRPRETGTGEPGTSSTPPCTLRFDILEKIASHLPQFPLVLHGASSVPPELITEINEFGGKISGAHGIPNDQLIRARQMNICKINIDSDSRLAFTAGVRRTLAERPEAFDPRVYLGAARDKMKELYKDKNINVMGSGHKTS